MGIECCKDCQDRHIGCHGSCPEYIAQAKAAREEREKRWKAQKGENGADAVLHMARRNFWLKRIKKGRKG